MMEEVPISWNSKRQALVSQFSCESKYYALNEVGKDGVWLRLLFQELGYVSVARMVI